MTIRSEQESDISRITEIHDLAFKGHNEGKIVKNLRKNKNLTISLVYEIDSRLAGHIAYSPIRNINAGIIGLGLAPVAVLPLMQNQGIGAKLIKHGNKDAFKMGFNKIFVLGEPKYYRRFDFGLAKEFNYFCEYDPKGDYFMVQGELSIEPKKTTVYYCKEFNV